MAQVQFKNLKTGEVTNVASSNTVDQIIASKDPTFWQATAKYENNSWIPISASSPVAPAPVAPVIQQQPIAPAPVANIPAPTPVNTPTTTGWIDPATGRDTPVGVGIPKTQTSPTQPPAGATYIDDPAKLKNYTESQIWRSPEGRIYALPQATLISPTGQKKVVTVGSTEANNLLNSGYSLMGADNSGVISSNTLKGENAINIGTGSNTANSYLADSTMAGIGVDLKSTQDAIAQYQKMLEAPESDLSRQVSQLLGEVSAGAQSLTGRGAAQLEAEQQAGITTQQQAIADKTTELNKKVAEVKALEASYNLANQQEEGRPQTLSRLQGAQAQNYKMFLAQKNALASEAGYIQAELLGMQGKLESAQNAVNRAIDLEYSDREAVYNAKLAQLQILQPQLEKEEARYATAVQMVLEQQQQALAEEKAQKQNLVSYNLGLMAEYPSAGIKTTDTPEVATQKVAKVAGVKATSGGTSGGGGGGYTYSSTPTTTPAPVTKTFEQFIAEKENQLGMSIAQPEKYRKEFERSQLVNTSKSQDADISKYSFLVQEVIKGNASADSILTGGTAGERSKYQNELLDAQKRGLLKSAPSEKQKTIFNQIVSKYNASPLIMAADRTITLKNSIDQVEKDPSNGTLQLNLVYSYIQALDTYQSAVREGELGLVNSIDSTIGKLKNDIQKIQNGQIVRPDVAKKIASAAKVIINTISEGAKAKEKSFASQANVNGVGDLWKEYQGGFVSSFNQSSTSGTTSSGIKYTITQ